MMDDGQWQRGDGEDADLVEMNVPSSSGEERARAERGRLPLRRSSRSAAARCACVLVVVAFLVDARLTLERKERDPDDWRRGGEMAHLCATAEVVAASVSAGTRGCAQRPRAAGAQLLRDDAHEHALPARRGALLGRQYDVAPASSGWRFHYGADVAPGYFCREPGPGSPRRPRPRSTGSTARRRGGQHVRLHWVFSTGGRRGARGVALGPGSAAPGRATNPYIGVQAVVYQVVNDGAAHAIDGLLYPQMDYAAHADDIVAYQGSTTGGGYDNDFCSPYQVSRRARRPPLIPLAMTRARRAPGLVARRPPLPHGLGRVARRHVQGGQGAVRHGGRRPPARVARARRRRAQRDEDVQPGDWARVVTPRRADVPTRAERFRGRTRREAPGADRSRDIV